MPPHPPSLFVEALKLEASTKVANKYYHNCSVNWSQEEYVSNKGTCLTMCILCQEACGSITLLNCPILPHGDNVVQIPPPQLCMPPFSACEDRQPELSES